MSKIRAMWMRPYKPWVEGTLANSLIQYRKRPYLQTWDKTLQVNRYVQYEYYLYLDLWIVKLQISWLGRHIKGNDLVKKDEV